MATVESEIEKLKHETLDGLDSSQDALDALCKDCCASADFLVADLVNGATTVIGVTQSVHEFLIFEQEVVNLFDIDPAEVIVGSDSLAQTEQDMQVLLASFDEKMDAMDVIGIAELMRVAVPEILQRFQVHLPLVRGLVYDIINK